MNGICRIATVTFRSGGGAGVEAGFGQAHRGCLSQMRDVGKWCVAGGPID
jgi:hypothetical protein